MNTGKHLRAKDSSAKAVQRLMTYKVTHRIALRISICMLMGILGVCPTLAQQNALRIVRSANAASAVANAAARPLEGITTHAVNAAANAARQNPPMGHYNIPSPRINLPPHNKMPDTIIVKPRITLPGKDVIVKPLEDLRTKILKMKRRINIQDIQNDIIIIGEIINPQKNLSIEYATHYAA